jgi:hypothetical protein
MGQYPEYSSKMNYVWQNVALTLKAFAAKLLPFIFSPWEDISTTSTVVGWATTTTKNIKYMVSGKMVTVMFQISGTSNAVTSTFTVPIASSSTSPASVDVCFGVDNGVPSYMTAALPPGTSTVNCLYQSSSLWTNSGLKQISGHIIYQID